MEILLKISINKSIICRVEKKEADISIFIARTEPDPRKRVTVKNPKFPKTEKALLNWYSKQREGNVPMTEELLNANSIFFTAKLKKKVEDSMLVVVGRKSSKKGGGFLTE